MTGGGPSCGHPLCELVGGDCSLATGVSRGCRTGPRSATPFAPEVIDEVSALLAQLGDDAEAARRRAAATRLAFVFRREARSDRSLMTLATEGELEPELGARLASLCRVQRG